MDQIPVPLAGGLTIALIVVLGIFVYPALLRRPQGKAVVGMATLLLSALFLIFDQRSGVSVGNPVVVAFALALAPVLTGAIVFRLQRGNPP